MGQWAPGPIPSQAFEEMRICTAKPLGLLVVWVTIGETDDLARSRCKILQYMLQDVTSVTMTSTWICQLRGFGFGYLEALFTGEGFIKPIEPSGCYNLSMACSCSEKNTCDTCSQRNIPIEASGVLYSSEYFGWEVISEHFRLWTLCWFNHLQWFNHIQSLRPYPNSMSESNVNILWIQVYMYTKQYDLHILYTHRSATKRFNLQVQLCAMAGGCKSFVIADKELVDAQTLKWV